MNNIKEYLGCAAACAAIRSNNNGADFVISSNSQIINILLFFTKYPLIGDKKNLRDFVKAADIIKNKRHLTCEGFGLLKVIKAGMNTGLAWQAAKVLPSAN